MLKGDLMHVRQGEPLRQSVVEGLVLGFVDDVKFAIY
jgi:hypothetical protein